MSELSFWREYGFALDVRTPVLMADGTTKPLHDVEVGDALAHPRGEPNVVTAVPFDDYDDEYEVEFEDGRVVRCNLDHLWRATHDGVDGVVSTGYMLEHPDVDFYVPTTKG